MSIQNWAWSVPQGDRGIGSSIPNSTARFYLRSNPIFLLLGLINLVRMFVPDILIRAESKIGGCILRRQMGTQASTDPVPHI